jgi:hypothetical protein
MTAPTASSATTFDPYEDAAPLRAATVDHQPRVKLLEQLCSYELELSNEIATLKESLKLKEAEYDNLMNSRIPDAVRADDPMLESVTLDDGTVIELEDKCHVNYKKEDEAKVYDFVIGRGNEKVLQYIFTVICGKGTHKEARIIQDFLSKFSGNENIQFEGTRYIHPVTLKALLKKLRSTVKLPEFISVFAPTLARISRTKTTSSATGDIFS